MQIHANPTVNCNQKRAGLKRLLADDVQGSFQEVENVISADSKKKLLGEELWRILCPKNPNGKIWQKTRLRQVTYALPVVNHQRHGRPGGSAEIPIGRHTDTKMHRFWPPTCRAARLRPALPPAWPNEPETQLRFLL